MQQHVAKNESVLATFSNTFNKVNLWSAREGKHEKLNSFHASGIWRNAVLGRVATNTIQILNSDYSLPQFGEENQNLSLQNNRQVILCSEVLTLKCFG